MLKKTWSSQVARSLFVFAGIMALLLFGIAHLVDIWRSEGVALFCLMQHRKWRDHEKPVKGVCDWSNQFQTAPEDGSQRSKHDCDVDNDPVMLSLAILICRRSCNGLYRH